ncbi:MAG: GNAT family N-acetyltransferase [Phycisphaerales bacterium]
MNAGPDPIVLRPAEPGRLAQIDSLYRETFPDEDLVPLVRRLMAFGPAVQSVVALKGDACVGHVAHTVCGVSGSGVTAALLGPLAVHPACQRQGVGGRLVHAVVEAARQNGDAGVFVLGDPGYYGRFGFVAEDLVRPPYELPAAWQTAWQAIWLSRQEPKPSGLLEVPEPWRDPKLWLP